MVPNAAVAEMQCQHQAALISLHGLQISGAKVRLHEAAQAAANQGLMERQLDISGALGQVQSAVHLVQAFMKAGNVPALSIPDI